MDRLLDNIREKCYVVVGYYVLVLVLSWTFHFEWTHKLFVWSLLIPFMGFIGALCWTAFRNTILSLCGVFVHSADVVAKKVNDRDKR